VIETLERPAITRGQETAALPAYMAGKRDLRIDLLRGAAIVAMVVDHVGGDQSWLYALTGGNRFYVSAAEAFLFLSGLVTIYPGVKHQLTGLMTDGVGQFFGGIQTAPPTGR
jgi:hypothetical protein